MDMDRIDRRRDYDYVNTDPLQRDPEPTRSDAQRGADRQAELIEASSLSYAAAPSVPPKCGYEDKVHVDACPTEKVTGGTLFIQGEGDVDRADANDIRQQQMGDCYLLASASAMMQTPEGRQHIRDMITEKTVDGKKVYEVTFRVPVNRTKLEILANKPAYTDKKVQVPESFVKGHAGVGDSKNGEQEIWPLVLEAGYAKLRGGYEKIANGGWPTTSLEALTGQKAVQKQMQTGVFGYNGAKLQKDFAAHNPIVIHFDAQKGGPDISTYGGFNSHAYAVTDVFQKNGATFVQLKNPWGNQDPAPIPLKQLEKLHPQVSIGKKPDDVEPDITQYAR